MFAGSTPWRWSTLRSLERRKSTARGNPSDKNWKGRKVMRRGLWILVLAASVIVAAALLVSGSGDFAASAEQTQTSNAEVKIDNFSFGPATLMGAAGTPVTWSKRDDIPHTPVSDDKTFQSKVLDNRQEISVQFT